MLAEWKGHSCQVGIDLFHEQSPGSQVDAELLSHARPSFHEHFLWTHTIQSFKSHTPKPRSGE